jgi:hypothetical protein
MQLFYSFDVNSYAGDGRCHNSEPGTFGHECGKPAEYVGTNSNGFRTGFCAKCATEGFERHAFKLQRIKEREVVGTRVYVFVVN